MIDIKKKIDDEIKLLKACIEEKEKSINEIISTNDYDINILYNTESIRNSLNNDKWMRDYYLAKLSAFTLVKVWVEDEINKKALEYRKKQELNTCFKKLKES